ncbi:MAG: NADH-quinone oxidoreductase subunit L [Deltaproteobacteria bacterium]
MMSWKRTAPGRIVTDMAPPYPFVPMASLLASAIPAVFAGAALGTSRTEPFRAASLASVAALGLAALTAGTYAATGGVLAPPPRGAVVPAITRWVHLDVLTLAVLLLVCTLGFVIVRYSRTYLEREQGLPRYVRSLLVTLSAVTLLVTSNHLLVIAAAWTATSLSLHQLLTFYRDRPRALVAAHKKFLLSRLADGCFIGSLALVHGVVGSLRLDDVNAWARTHGSLPPAMHVATTLLVLGVAMKTAQIPFHGWLTQVMEAPTPVSALLHAGVVNVGGLVLIRLAPLMHHAWIARGILGAIGLATAVVGSLVMTTRPSIKATLAWSTIAQMGLMLVECALGATHLALLHLVAHSLYKAHAFLSAGTTVQSWRALSLVSLPANSGARVVAATAIAAGVVGAVAAVMVRTGLLHAGPSLAPIGLILALSATPLLLGVADEPARAVARAVLRVAMVASSYFGWHALFGRWVPAAPESPGLVLAWSAVAAAFVALFLVEAALSVRPRSRLARWLHPRLAAGLYLDELFTRATFRVWPPRLGESSARGGAHGGTAALVVRS